MLPRSCIKSRLSRGFTGYRGFTIVEVLMVLAISAIVLLIGVQTFRGMMAKSRQAEAKTALARQYFAERTFFGAFQSYTSCLEQLKALPHAAGRDYFSGFYNQSASLNTCGPGRVYSCDSYDYGGNAPNGNGICTAETFTDSFGASCSGQNCFPPGPVASGVTDYMGSANFTMTQTTFTAGAVGVIESGHIADVWTMNDAKTLLNPQSGL